MANNRYDFGDLNPATHPQTGRTLDPDSFSGIGNIAEAAQRVNRPSFIEKLGFPLKGIVLRVEESDSWIDRILAFAGAEIEARIKCRVRIPELHSHLPIPETYGEGGLNSIMMMYPLFVAKENGGDKPVVGDLCYVDFLDRNRFQDPIYLGKITNKPDNGAGSTARNGDEVSEEVGLEMSAPPGDPIGGYGDEQSLEEVSTETTQVPKEQSTAKRDPLITTPQPPTTYLFPVKGGIVTSAFGLRTDPKTGKRNSGHNAIDIACAAVPCEGTPIYACTDAVVDQIWWNSATAGQAVLLQHDDGFSSRYLHLSKIMVKRRGQKVKRGDLIGLMGNTGKSTGDHLHWRVKSPPNRNNGKSIDPMTTLKGTFPLRRKGRKIRGSSSAPGVSTDYTN